MKTISQIGKAALLRIFKPFYKTESGVEIERTVDFPKHELSLTQAIFTYELEESGVEKIIYTTKIQLWSIWTGLQDVEIGVDGEMLGPFIAKHKGWRTEAVPSHVALIQTKEVFSEINPLVKHTKHEDVYVYRISQKNFEDIQEWIDSEMANHDEINHYKSSRQ